MVNQVTIMDAIGRTGAGTGTDRHSDTGTDRDRDRESDANPGPVIELRGAAVAVGGRTLWSEVNLAVGAGEFVAVLGPNGVGKSTLIKVLLGLMPTAAGSVSVLGRPPGAAGNRIGYLPQRRSF